MNKDSYLQQFSQNTIAFVSLLSGASDEEHLWRPAPGKWCLLEIVCHLCDEERDDFRARVHHVLETPGQPMPPIDPPGWVTERKYLTQNFEEMLNQFVRERKKSALWLQELPPLTDPVWDNAYQHPTLGAMGAKMLLANWLAHDHLHLRQIVRLKYERLKALGGQPLAYAGEW